MLLPLPEDTALYCFFMVLLHVADVAAAVAFCCFCIETCRDHYKALLLQPAAT